ncbi:MAG: valine--tRNA ligase [Halobacteriaceae archaeon]
MSEQTQRTRELPESYEPDEIEPRRQAAWRDSDLYEYDPEEDAPDYVIDTPPPYPTGNMHIGNALGWCYMDFAARYKRLQGFDVSFPQGWDCHGLPTEVKVEENHDIHRTDVPREEFREMCIEHTESQVEAMRETMDRLGFSQDWSQEYRTMDPEYWGKTQRSFVEMADDGLVYRDEHPVNWCPRCETAIADAEVETADRTGTLHYIRFPGRGNDDLEIATTRPELLPACVAMAVDPEDERFADRIGETFEVPLFGQEVELIGDDAVDSDFGTGAVMVCTFGDKQDVDWWAGYDLDLRPVLTEDGRLSDLAGEYEGLDVDAAKEAIAADLDAEGFLQETETTEQSVGVCWRCDTPIEILSKEQWFVEVDGDAILDRAQEVEWIPPHMYDRLEDWTEGMEWDWVISRQRVFATPIPAWQCEDCEEWLIATEEELPVDPDQTAPDRPCPACGGTSFRPETDVMDTWMDSSITALHAAGWPEESFEPVQLREQGHDIIRTWAFYTLLRTDALADAKPWDQALINGMVFGEDGRKMSKSRGNFVQPEEAVEEYSADAFRQALALGGQPGTDIQFQWKEMTSASRFLTKLWNVARFASGHFDERTPDISAPAYRDADAWILKRLKSVVTEVAELMDDYRFDAALRTIREFVWDDLADDYVELVKGRLYNGRPGERDAARHALYTAVSTVLRLLAPFSPHITAELWDYLPGTTGSIHTARWPSVPDVHPEAADRGATIATVASEIRAWKSESGMALNEPLERVELYFETDRPVDTYDLSETVGAPIRLETGSPSVELTPVAVDPDHATIGPAFRDRAEAVIDALEAAEPAEIQADLNTGDGEIDLDLETGDTVTLDPEMVTIREELQATSGETVEVLEAGDVTILIVP